MNIEDIKPVGSYAMDYINYLKKEVEEEELKEMREKAAKSKDKDDNKRAGGRREKRPSICNLSTLGTTEYSKEINVISVITTE